MKNIYGRSSCAGPWLHGFPFASNATLSSRLVSLGWFFSLFSTAIGFWIFLSVIQFVSSFVIVYLLDLVPVSVEVRG